VPRSLLVIVALASVALGVSGCSSAEPTATRLSLVSDRGLVDAEVSFSGPVARGDNELVVELTPRAGDDEARLLAVDATMAAHAHVAHAGHIDDAGAAFHVQELDLFMTGRWQVELSLSLSDAEDTLSFPVDVP
jgi:hypothetical protein